ncbi:MAG: DNA-binding protein [Candidatus Bathyarchaeota archaeon]|nr:DNA-binding protein [Candidatus Bathyarchaeum tardum]WGM90692.1 MAG: DNA-binding protein [Candidatus Bathyarchaeum tardum]WNZ30427.1 MAG: DNA-binding protein [Candidatus Bathyarchaeota archaeon]
MVSEEELDSLRKRRMHELQQRMEAEQQQAQAQQNLENQKQALLRRILTPEARSRLTNLNMVKPEFTEQLEIQLIQLAQAGRVKLPITDEQLKELLVRLQSGKRDYTIRRV